MKPNKIVIGIGGILLGAFSVLALRFVSYNPPKNTHYHANFAVYIDGQQEQFSNPLLYEEISKCSLSTVKMPGGRAHLHGQVKDVVHVEDEAVSWGNLFQNIGWNVSKEYVDTSETLLSKTDTKKVTYILNGETLDSITNKVIGDKDRLLVSYGDSSQDELNKQFETVATTAEKANTTKDPESCSGSENNTSFSERMKHLF